MTYLADDHRTDWVPFAQTRGFEASYFEYLTYEWYFVGDVIGGQKS